MIRFAFTLLVAALFITAPAQAGDKGMKYTRYDNMGVNQGTERDFEYMAKNLTRADIKDIQSALNEAGYTPGPVDGVVGPKTRHGIREFQAAHKIPQSGKLDGKTLRELKAYSWRNYDHRDGNNYND